MYQCIELENIMYTTQVLVLSHTKSIVRFGALFIYLNLYIKKDFAPFNSQTTTTHVFRLCRYQTSNTNAKPFIPYTLRRPRQLVPNGHSHQHHCVTLRKTIRPSTRAFNFSFWISHLPGFRTRRIHKTLSSASRCLPHFCSVHQFRCYGQTTVVERRT